MFDMQVDALLKAVAATFGALVLLAYLDAVVASIIRKRSRSGAQIIAAMERLGLAAWRRGDVMVYLDSERGWRMLAFGTTPGGGSVQWEIEA